MAAGKYQESYSSRFSNYKYQVFLSFRGEDTGKNFTDHLYKALVDAGIHTFRDDNEIRRGENIYFELQKAIQESKISIIVFSKNYASSRWCLDELVMIMERRRTTGSIVFPVFYDVLPSEVRNQTGSFAAAFVEQEKPFKEEMEQVNGWRIALREVADLAGMVLGDGYEAQFVQSIVENVSKNLDPKIFYVPLHFIGRDPLVQYINSWLQDGSHGVATALLYGIGGVGKTAIAKSVFNENYYKFEGKSFLSNFRSKDIVCLQRQLLSDILNKTVDEINDEGEGILKIKDALRCRSTLIVLDDVDKRDQFNKIVGMQNWLCKGSKIIVTTRNKGLFSANDIKWFECKVEPLDNKKSLELFSWNAFGRAYPVDGFVEDSWRIVHHCNGLPLALRVIGSSLSGKGREIWESAFQQMEVIPNFEVQKVLRISYDFLDGDYPKNLFLDIACFFNAMDVADVVRILDGLNKGARFGIDNLIDRCLVEINTSDQRLWMHQLVRDMGREIAHQESPKCQRIWHHWDAFTVLKGTTDAEKLRGLTIDMHALLKYHYAEVVCTDSMVCRKRRRLNFFKQWLSNFSDGGKLQTGQTSLFPILSADVFRKMPDVKFLQLNYTNFHGSFEHFPKNLIWLCWHGLSSRSIPIHACLEKLVVLDLSRSCLVDAWKGKLFLPKLKVLDLRHSHDLFRTPDFSGLPALEKLILEDCIRLVQIHKSIGDLQRLFILNIRNCTSLTELPEEMSRLNSLQELVLDGCSNLDSLNMELEHQQGRKLLQSDGIVASTSFISSLPLKLFFPSRFSTRKMLRFTLFSLPRLLESLDLSGTPIRFLPESIKDLGLLRHLYLRNCKMLQALPELPPHMDSLDESFCYSLQRLANPNHSVKFQDRIKQELIQMFDSHMLRIMETVSAQIQPSRFQITFMDGIFNVVVPVFDEDEELRGFYEQEEEDKWLIQKEFVDNFSFKISSSPPAHRICGSNLFISCVTSAYRGFNYVYIEIRNNTSGLSMLRRAYVSSTIYRRDAREIQSLLHTKLGGNDPTFDNGDDVSISVRPHGPAIQLRTVYRSFGAPRYTGSKTRQSGPFNQLTDQANHSHPIVSSEIQRRIEFCSTASATPQKGRSTGLKQNPVGFNRFHRLIWPEKGRDPRRPPKLQVVDSPSSAINGRRDHHHRNPLPQIYQDRRFVSQKASRKISPVPTVAARESHAPPVAFS
ncbi:TMV resistance protein N [Populus alba x Populus x berolinensis]|uniref:TMV resistance protein N n=1 Tax=Populus alba x Populus x berolinensis TaxID=444605 RepID=A0AAD6M472_9ROSI|nr:TMV resistance protein N [Populus alba x Populus x berolinensis]